ncbi:uncharacterized protein TNIN_427581 [Trichonephila inaurata madagascariensis]|uniref:Gustatory receptor n=1 Tax=Trichonephila inaurata madagascariensis TaxID=2747483 RepID=A0A8X6JAI0_9ARAC|nr:uncharacterized protein TNIN_427581 [Trichonephila inaurata madagascariensis]
MALRLSISFKRRQIIYLISQLETFISKYQMKPYVSKKKEIDFLCFLNVFVPLTLGSIIVLYYMENFEEVRNEFKPDLLQYFEKHSIQEKIAVLLFTFAYMLHFYVTSMLCITMFTTIYNTFEDALKQMLVETYRSLCTDISSKNLVKASELILKVQAMHQEIENVLSFSIFLVYVLVFVNFLNLVSVNVTNFTSPQLKFRVFACVIVFIWTTSNFVKLTLTGSKLVDICDLWKLLQQDIVRNCARMKIKNSKNLTYLLLFLEESKLDLEFTGWGIFRLDRSLLLTIAEAIVSYSVVIATV